MIGVLVSGEGTNLQALIDAGLPIVAVASNKPGATRARPRPPAKIPTAVFEPRLPPDREARDLAMAAWLEEHGVGWSSWPATCTC